jgi:pimeloyl-ACP methyl ester carboxylesterase
MFFALAAFLVLDLLLVVVYTGRLLTHWCLGSSRHHNPPWPASDFLIVLLHGSGADDVQFLLARRFLRDLPVVTLNIPHTRSTTIRECAETLHATLRDHPATQLVLVGVSMGGLVAAAAAYNYLAPGRVAGVVTIGSPWRGAPLLLRTPDWFRLPQRHVEMTPGSAVLAGLGKQASERMDIPLLTIGSLADLHVPDAYSTPGKFVHHEHVSLQVPGHIALTLDWRIWRRVRSFALQLL